MFHKIRNKNLINLDRFLLNDKQNTKNYQNSRNHNKYISSRNKKNNNPLKKSSSQMSINNSYFNKTYYNIQSNSNKNSLPIKKNIPPNNNMYDKYKKTQRNINIKPYNKHDLKKTLLNYSVFNENINKKSKSLSQKKTINCNNIKMDKNNYSFINNRKNITPIFARGNNNNKTFCKNNNKYNNKKNRNNDLNLYENRSMRHNNSIFQPINIFSKYKRNKINNNNNDEVSKNSQLLNKFIKDGYESNQNIINKNNSFKINKNNKNNIFENNIFSTTNNKTNDSTPISSRNILISKTNNNTNKSFIFNKTHTVHEINFHVRGISLDNNNKNISQRKKKRIFKGKIIKCIHDLSKTGLAGDDKKVNQDNYFIFKNFVQGFNNIFMGVCDGHGYYGHEVSGYIKENLPMDLNHMIKNEKLDLLKDDLSPIIKKTFILENKSLLRNKQINSDLSGSTCVSVIYTPEKLIIANIGDSRAVLGKCIEKKDRNQFEKIFEIDNKTKWVAKNLSRDHKPIIAEEAQRIIKKGGRIRPMKDEDGEFIGPLRVYMREKDMPGLAMTRSFGDYFGSIAGVIAEPEVTEYFLKEEDKFMILASDGLFEFMGSQEVVDIVKDYYEKNDIVGCCEYLYKESTRKWLKEEEDIIDDITMILVFFDNYYIEVDS